MKNEEAATHNEGNRELSNLFAIIAAMRARQKCSPKENEANGSGVVGLLRDVVHPVRKFDTFGVRLHLM